MGDDEPNITMEFLLDKIKWIKDNSTRVAEFKNKVKKFFDDIEKWRLFAKNNERTSIFHPDMLDETYNYTDRYNVFKSCITNLRSLSRISVCLNILEDIEIDNKTKSYLKSIELLSKLRNKPVSRENAFGSIKCAQGVNQDIIVTNDIGVLGLIYAITEITHDLQGKLLSQVAINYDILCLIVEIRKLGIVEVDTNSIVNYLRPLSEHQFVDFCMRCVESYECGIFAYQRNNYVEFLDPDRFDTDSISSGGFNPVTFRQSYTSTIIPDAGSWNRLELGSGQFDELSTNKAKDMLSSFDAGDAGNLLRYEENFNPEILRESRQNVQYPNSSIFFQYYVKGSSVFIRIYIRVDKNKKGKIIKKTKGVAFFTANDKKVLHSINIEDGETLSISNCEAYTKEIMKKHLGNHWVKKIENNYKIYKKYVVDGKKSNYINIIKLNLDLFQACKHLKQIMDTTYLMDRVILSTINPGLSFDNFGGDYAKIYFMLFVYKNPQAANTLLNLRIPRSGMITGVIGPCNRLAFSEISTTYKQQNDSTNVAKYIVGRLPDNSIDSNNLINASRTIDKYLKLPDNSNQNYDFIVELKIILELVSKYITQNKDIERHANLIVSRYKNLFERYLQYMLHPNNGDLLVAVNTIYGEARKIINASNSKNRIIRDSLENNEILDEKFKTFPEMQGEKIPRAYFDDYPHIFNRACELNMEIKKERTAEKSANKSSNQISSSMDVVVVDEPSKQNSKKQKTKGGKKTKKHINKQKYRTKAKKASTRKR